MYFKRKLCFGSTRAKRPVRGFVRWDLRVEAFSPRVIFVLCSVTRSAANARPARKLYQLFALCPFAFFLSLLPDPFLGFLQLTV